MSRIVDNAPVGVEPKTRQDIRDERDEREAEEWWAMYDIVKAEKDAAGKSDAPLVLMAEVDRRLKEKYAKE